MSFRLEPTILIAFLAAVLGLIVAFNFTWLTAEEAALIVAVVNALLGVWNAVKVRPIAPAAFTYAVAAIAALLAGYGLHLSQQMVGAVDGVVLAGLALLTRAQVTPVPAVARPANNSTLD